MTKPAFIGGIIILENKEVLNIRISEQLKASLSKQAQQQNQSLSDYVRELLARDVIQQSTTTITPTLREKFQANANILGMPLSALVNTCLSIGAYVQPQSWRKLKFNRERTRRRLTEAQQIVDIVNRHFNAPPVKWARKGIR
jgi:antitoxin component of RelBE/YafQ-DinJ toxin-antitoxin module